MKLKNTLLKTGLYLFMIIASPTLFAQSNYGEIRGTVKDEISKSPLEYATVQIFKEGVFISGTTTDLNGNFIVKTLDPGLYTIKISTVGYTPIDIEGVNISANQITFRDFVMSKGQTLKTITITDKKIIEKDQNQTTLEEKDIKQLGTRNLGQIAQLQSGVTLTPGGGVSFRGSRTDGTAIFIDGVRVIGSNAQTQAAQGQISIIQSGIPAQFGDFTGGVISVTTRGASRERRSSFEALSSSPFNAYHWNQMEGFTSGPLLFKDKGQKSKERVVLGYMLAGNLNYRKDPSPSAVGIWKVKDDVLDQMIENPLVATPDGSFVHAAHYLTEDDMENVKARPNSANYGGVLQGKLDYQPTKNSTITLYSSYGSSTLTAANSQTLNERYNANSVLNYRLNPTNRSDKITTYLRFTQNLPNPDVEKMKTKTTISNAFYTVRIDYQRDSRRIEDSRHGQNTFEYGYLGRFTKYQAPLYTYQGSQNNPNTPSRMFIDQNGDTVYLNNYWEQQGFRDTLLTFDAAEYNPMRANYTSRLYEAFAERGQTITNEFAIQQNQALLNGFNPAIIYSLFSAPGQVSANMVKGMFERYTVFAMSEAQLKGPTQNKNSSPHDLQFGLMYEQSIDRQWGLNANSLWQLMPQFTNTHITELDRSKPILSYDANGVFQDTVSYNRFINSAAQTNFDRNLRNKLMQEGRTDRHGNLITQSSFIDINSFAPEDFSLDLFSADELLNNGNSRVSYYGYDHLGNPVRGKPSVEDFTNSDRRLVGAFMPIYSAAWVQDKFAYKDLIFRLGLRVERYDANQVVLRDPYSLYPIRTRAEVRDINGAEVTHPENIGNDYQVYVNDINNPTRILGYRNKDQWFDAGGNEIANAELISNQTTTGRISPYLVDHNAQELGSNSFRDYTPVLSVLPRVWFSFPIREEALFYASFDVLAQRPNQGFSFLTIDEYYFMDQRNVRTIANPNLQPRIKTDYQIGFKTALGEESRASLNLMAYYAEIKNDIQLFFYNQAYPISYISYSNIDFSTIKGFTGEYDLFGDYLSFHGGYSIQFADGTGSNPNSARALIQTGQPNLRTLFPLGELDIRHQARIRINYNFGGLDPRTRKNNYKGPIVGGKEVLKNTNANLMVIGNSGLPYTRTNQPVQFGSADRAQIQGTPFGSRLPWQYTLNLNLEKTHMIKRKEDSEGNPKGYIQARFFLMVENLLNTLNVNSVYSYSGLPDDDGFINSPRGQQAVAQQLSAQSYSDLYRIFLNSPNNYAMPRMARLGVRFEF